MPQFSKESVVPYFSDYVLVTSNVNGDDDIEFANNTVGKGGGGGEGGENCSLPISYIIVGKAHDCAPPTNAHNTQQTTHTHTSVIRHH